MGCFCFDHPPPPRFLLRATSREYGHTAALGQASFPPSACTRQPARAPSLPAATATGLGSIVILGNKLSSYGDRLLDARARADPTNALLRVGPLLQDIDLLPYPSSDRAEWRRDVDKLPGLERAFNDLALSFSGPEARGSAEGAKALRDRPLEFVETEDGELVTGRAAPA